MGLQLKVRSVAMKAPLKILAAALCGLLLGLPAAQADEDDFWPITDVYVQFGGEHGQLMVSPSELTLQAGELYLIVLINPSELTHVVAAPELAGNGLTTELLQGFEDVDYPAASITAGISLAPGQTIEWTFMPLEEGTFKLGCEDTLHAAAGMHAMIKVVYEMI